MVKSTFLIENPILIGFLKVIGIQNQFPISFGTAYACKFYIKG